MRLKNSSGSMLIIFIAIIIIAVVVFPFLKGVMQGFSEGKSEANQAFTAAMMMGISSAINTYYETNGSYPATLDSLMHPSDGSPPYITEESLKIKGYEYEYSNLSDNYALKYNPISSKGSFFYIDKSRQIRVNKDSPANENSDFYRVNPD